MGAIRPSAQFKALGLKGEWGGGTESLQLVSIHMCGPPKADTHKRGFTVTEEIT